MEWRELWGDLSHEIKWQFESQSRTVTLKRGESVYRQGDLPSGLYFVKTGLVGLVIVGSTSGKEHLLRFFRQNQFFGHRALFSDEGYHGSAVALEPTILKMISKDIVLSMVEKNPNLLLQTVKVLSKELRRCETHQIMILENQILVRVAQAIVYLKDIHPDHNWTRQEIANFCASTVSTVIKALSELEAMGLIHQEGRSIEILNRDALVALQDREYL